MSKLPIKKSYKKASTPGSSVPPIKKTIVRARKLVEAMLSTMEKELQKAEPSEQWQRLFGTKDSAVVSLQKLVQVIGLLSNQVDALYTQNSSSSSVPQLTKEEMDLLTEWMKQGPG